MLLSRGCEYGIRAALYVAVNQSAGYVPIRVISRDLGLPAHFLTKILQQLTHSGIMKSHRGPNGGVSLAKPANEITLKDVVLAVDGPAVFEECVLGMPGCGDEKPCPLHKKWIESRAKLDKLFHRTTVAAVAARIAREDLRISAVQ